MSDEPTQIPADAPAPVAEARVDVPPPAEPASTAMPTEPDPHPEYIVAGAFAGAFVAAKILRRIGGA